VRPLIGLTTYGDQARYGSNNLYSAMLPMAYVRAVNASGGRAVLIPEDDPGTDVLDALDGIIFTGGGDVTPCYYGAEADPETIPVPARDASEMVLMRAALDADLPILAICRGMQLLAAASGGTLHQHLPDVLGHGEHQLGGFQFNRVPVHVRPESQLSQLIGSDVQAVPVAHHQAVDKLGEGLVASAWTRDQVVEAIEYPAATFALGIQWHPEELSEDFGLFRGFIEAARAKYLSRLSPATPSPIADSPAVFLPDSTPAILVNPEAF
jgi:putative glutamine amidotransferase